VAANDSGPGHGCVGEGAPALYDNQAKQIPGFFAEFRKRHPADPVIVLTRSSERNPAGRRSKGKALRKEGQFRLLPLSQKVSCT